MRKTQTLIINGVDYSDYIQHFVGVDETPIYTDGVNTGETDSGIQIFDRARVRYGATRALRPLPQSMFEALVSACGLNSVPVTITLGRYANDQSFMAQIAVSGYSYSLTQDGTRIYSGATISINPR